MRKGWDDALEFQNGLRHAMTGDRSRYNQYARYLRWFSTGQSKGYVYDENMVAPVREGPMSETDMNMIAAYATANAVSEEYEPMWVNDEVIDLVEYASETFKPEALMPWDLIVPEAFCVFERALRTKDIEGREISFRAASWGHYGSANLSEPEHPGLLIALWHHAADEDDYSRNNPIFTRAIGGSPLLLIQTVRTVWEDPKALMDPASHALFKQLQVLWRLAKQHVAVTAHEQVSRPTWRHKYNNWREIKHVTVFTLRRAKRGTHHGESGEAHYSHRFPVRGHWRDQWYPSLKMHRQKFIEGYIKGPDDAPLMLKKQATEFIR